MNQKTKKYFQNRMEAVFAPWVCAHLNSTASGVTHKTPAAAMETPRARSESWTIFYIDEQARAARLRESAGQLRGSRARSRRRAGRLGQQLKGLHVRFRAFSTWPQIFCLTAFLLPLAARPAMMLILPCQRSSLRAQVNCIKI